MVQNAARHAYLVAVVEGLGDVDGVCHDVDVLKVTALIQLFCKFQHRRSRVQKDGRVGMNQLQRLAGDSLFLIIEQFCSQMSIILNMIFVIEQGIAAGSGYLVRFLKDQ